MSVNFSPNGKWIALGSNHSRVATAKIPKQNLNKLEYDTVDLKVDSNKNAVTSIAFSPDSTKLICGLQMGDIKILTLSNNEIATLKGHESNVSSISFSSDSNIFASGSHNATIKIWNVENKKLIRTMDELNLMPGSRVQCISFYPEEGAKQTGIEEEEEEKTNIENKQIQKVINLVLSGERNTIQARLILKSLGFSPEKIDQIIDDLQKKLNERN
jgi:WD40 repeat protein